MLYKSYKKINSLNLISKFFLIFIIFSLYFLFIRNNKKREPFNNKIIELNEKNFFDQKYDEEIYDNFYSKLYDYIYLNNKKNEDEINYIKSYFKDFNYTKILDVGCGTGNHVNLLNENYNIVGIDSSKEMINIAKKKYPKCDFQNIDFLANNFFDNNTYTHILCLNKAFYEIKNIKNFFMQCNSLLNNNGYLIINLIDKNNFTPYTSETTKKIKVIYDPKKNDIKPHSKIVKFNEDIEVISKCNTKKINETNEIVYSETFKNFKTNSVRKNEISYKLHDINIIKKIAAKNNLFLRKKIELKNYKDEFLYIFVKK